MLSVCWRAVSPLVKLVVRSKSSPLQLLCSPSYSSSSAGAAPRPLIDDLRFECTQCGRCCVDSHVSLSQSETRALAHYLGVSTKEFARRFLTADGRALATDALHLATAARSRSSALRALATDHQKALEVDSHSVEGSKTTWSPKEHSVCRLLDVESGRCTVHEARPVRCGVYPFRPQTLRSAADWQEEAESRCEGIRSSAPVVPRHKLQLILSAWYLHEHSLQAPGNSVDDLAVPQETASSATTRKEGAEKEQEKTKTKKSTDGQTKSSDNETEAAKEEEEEKEKEEKEEEKEEETQEALSISYSTWIEWIESQFTESELDSITDDFLEEHSYTLLDRSVCGSVKVLEKIHTPSSDSDEVLIRRSMEFANSPDFEQSAVLATRDAPRRLLLDRLLSPVHEALLAALSPSDARPRNRSATASLVFVLGGGGCVLSSAGSRLHKDLRFVTAELDPIVAQLAREHFLGDKVPTNFELRVCDGIEMVRNASDRSLHALLVDVASKQTSERTENGDPPMVLIPPPLFLTDRFLGEARRALSPDGVLAMNVCLESGISSRAAFRQHLAPLCHRNGFPLVRVVPILAHRQFVLIASCAHPGLSSWTQSWQWYREKSQTRSELDHCVEYRGE